MVAAGAADGHGDVGTIAGGKARQPFAQVGEQVLIHFLDIRLGVQVVAHHLFQAAVLAQVRLPVGVGQAAHVEHQVGVHRHAALEAEGFDQERGTGFRLVK
ncbi:hypothetical protein D3C80_1157930 [compost metagenome]